MRSTRSPRPSILLQLVIESDPVDVEDFGGAALIASTILHYPQDVGALHIFKGLARSVGDALRLEDEVLFAQLRLLAYHHGALDRVFQFANVSQPRLLLQ